MQPRDAVTIGSFFAAFDVGRRPIRRPVLHQCKHRNQPGGDSGAVQFQVADAFRFPATGECGAPITGVGDFGERPVMTEQRDDAVNGEA